MIQKQDPSSSMQRLGNVEGWRLDTIQDFLCKLAMKPQMNLLEISIFFIISFHRQTYQNYQQPPKRLQNSDFQSLFLHQKSD